MTELSTFDKACRLIEFATGERYGDGETVTNVISGYAEPRYGAGGDVIVTGNWNPRHVPDTGDRWKSTDPRVTLPARLARSLERIGASIEWSDEWAECSDCYRAVRTEPDSYSWKPFYTWTDDGIVCADCLIGDGIDAITGYGSDDASYINAPAKCLTWCEPSHVESLGFVKWAPGAEHTYESGWRPGQTDDPTLILATILEANPAAEVAFFLDESSQFYIRFSAYVRNLDA